MLKERKDTPEESGISESIYSKSLEVGVENEELLSTNKEEEIVVSAMFF